MDLAVDAVVDGNGGAGVIDEHLFAGAVLLAQGYVPGAVPLPIQIAEATVTVALLPSLSVFLPQQLQRQILVTLQFLVNGGKIGRRVDAAAGRSGPIAENELIELLIAEVFR